jgi:hypothetical protein
LTWRYKFESQMMVIEFMGVDEIVGKKVKIEIGPEG